MLIKTDPARELSELIRSLNISPDVRFDGGIAELFNVKLWSSEFYEVIFTINSRIDELIAITDIIPLDDDQKSEMKVSLQNIQQAFGPTGLQSEFKHSQQHYLSNANVSPLSALSGLVRPLRSYPKLNEAELSELLAMVDTLVSWLNEHQLSEQDFIRQALIEGLSRVQFRLARIQWLGWGYTLQGLREVISAYFALERGMPQDGTNPPAEAMIKHLTKFVHDFFEKAGFAKDVIETGDFMLKAYGAVQLLIAGQTTIAGLLTHGSL